MRPGHKWSGGLEKGFEPNAQVHIMFMPIPQGQLVDEDRAQGEPTGVRQPFRRHLSVTIEDPFELLIEVLDRRRAQLVEEAAYLHPVVRVRIPPRLRGHQAALVLLTQLAQLHGVVMLVAQDKAYLRRDATQQVGSNLIVGHIRGGQLSRHGNPDLGHGRHEVQFPAIDPAMPARLGPMRRRVNRAVGHLAGLTILLVPDPAARAAPYYRSPPRAHSLPRAGSRRRDSVPSSQSGPARCRAGPASGVPRCGEPGTCRFQSAGSASIAFRAWTARGRRGIHGRYADAARS